MRVHLIRVSALDSEACYGKCLLKNLVKHIATAVSFLTVFPVPKGFVGTFAAADLAQCFSFFPLAGLLIGTCCLLAALALHQWMPALLTGVVLTALLAILTRGLHLDGLADLTDGIGGGYTIERRLEIMKDSNIGTFGSLALVLALLFKVASLHVLLKTSYWPPILLVPSFSRLAMVFTAFKSTYARPEGGLGKPFLESMTIKQPLVSTGLTCFIALLISPGLMVLYFPAVVLCAALFRSIGHRWLGGVTGDVLGATNEVTEIVLFSLSACIVSHL